MINSKKENEYKDSRTKLINSQTLFLSLLGNDGEITITEDIAEDVNNFLNKNIEKISSIKGKGLKFIVKSLNRNVVIFTTKQDS